MKASACRAPDVVVIDVSFISLKAVLPVALSLAAAHRCICWR
jgi:predicted rRNA methylase YqxC with S4 and FtsJ domains